MKGVVFMSVGSTIRKIREEHGMSQKELAEIAGVTFSSVSLWELGKTEPRMGALQKIADYFHIKKTDLIDDEPSSSFMPKFDNLFVGKEGLSLSNSKINEKTTPHNNNDYIDYAIQAISRNIDTGAIDLQDDFSATALKIAEIYDKLSDRASKKALLAFANTLIKNQVSNKSNNDSPDK